MTPRLELVASGMSAEEKLELLMRLAEKGVGIERTQLLEQLIEFLRENLNLVNKVPGKFHSNPLELVINIGDTRFIKELLSLNAQVRPERSNLLSKIQNLLKSNNSNDNTYRFR